MSKCQKCCDDKSFDCLCYKKRQRNCGCSERRCHCNQKMVKDCVCVEWSVQPGRTQTVFQTGGYRNIFASGFVSFDAGSSDSVIVRFFLGSNQIGSSVRVFEESSFAFSYTRFDRITVEYPIIDTIPLEVGEGEICIKTRTPVY